MKEIIRKINGNMFYISALDFQGDNKKFYITFRTINGISGFDLVINEKFVNPTGREYLKKELEYVLDNPRKAIVNKYRKLIGIYKKLKFYRKKQSQKEKQLFEKIIKDNIKLTSMEKFKLSNKSGQSRVLDYLNDLTRMDKYKLEV